MMPNASKELIDLLYKLLAYDPAERITAKEALRHEYFSDITTEKFRTTIFGAHTGGSIGKQVDHDDTP